MPVLASDALGHRHALFLGLVRQHGAAHHVAHGPHAGQVAAAVGIDHDGAALIELQPDRLRVQPGGIGHPANRDDELVGFQRLRLAFGVAVGNRDAFFERLDLAHLHPELDFQALLVESFFGFARNLLIDRTQEHRQPFEHGDIGPEAAPNRAEFEPDHARADHCQALGHCAQTQAAVVGEHVDFIERHPRQGARAGARGHDHLLGGQGLWFSARPCRHRDFVAALEGAHEAAPAVEKRDLVLLEQVQDAVVVLLDHRVFAAQHLAHVDLDRAGADAVLAKVQPRVLKMLGRLQQRLGRDAADVGAGAARGGATVGVAPGVDARHLEAELGGADGGDIATGASADDDHIKCLAHGRALQLTD